MFNVGGMELVVIGLVALIVLGPDKLPGALRQAGNALGELRRISQGFQADLRSALDEAEREAESAADAGTHARSASAPEPPAAAVPPAEAARAELAEMDATTDDDIGA